MLDGELRHAVVSMHPPNIIHEDFKHCIAFAAACRTDTGQACTDVITTQTMQVFLMI